LCRGPQSPGGADAADGLLNVIRAKTSFLRRSSSLVEKLLELRTTRGFECLKDDDIILAHDHELSTRLEAKAGADLLWDDDLTS